MSDTSYKPQVGDHGDFTANDGTTVEKAEVIHVWGDTCVNLKTESGALPTSVLIQQPGCAGYFFTPEPERRFSFDELVQYGVEAGGKGNGGMPWSFKLYGFPVSHENNDCYIIGDGSAHGCMLRRGDTLVVEAGAKTVRVLDQAHASKDVEKGDLIYTDRNSIEVHAATEPVELAGHKYAVVDRQAGTLVTDIEFQNGPIKEVGINGVQNEHLLAVLIHRTKQLDAKFPSRENAEALSHMKAALRAFEARTAKRVERGVEGQSVA